MSVPLSRSQPEGANLVGALRRFGEIAPVYEVIGWAEPEHVGICLVESGDVAGCPVAEVRLDPEA